MKKITKVVAFILILALSITGCIKDISNKAEEISPSPKITDNTDNSKKESQSIKFSNTTKTNIGDDLPITRGQVARMIALTFSDTTTINSVKPKFAFLDLDKSAWYYNFANQCANLGYLKGDGINFFPNNDLTLKQAETILNLIDKTNQNKIQIEQGTENNPISYGLWTKLFCEAITNLSANSDLLSKFGISEKNVTVLATSANNSNLNFEIITDNGPKIAEGLCLDNFLDNSINIYEKGNQIICLNKVTSSSPTIKNSYIVNYDGNTIKVFVGGVTRTFKINNGKNADINGKICDIKIQNGYAKSLSVHTNNLTDNIKSVDGNNIIFENSGSFTLDPDFKVYSIVSGILKWKTMADLRVGREIVSFIKKGNIVVAAIIQKDDVPKNIKVALNTTGFQGLIHQNVTLTCDKNFLVKGLKKSENFNAGDKFVVDDKNNTDLFGNDFVTVIPDAGGKIQIDSIKRSGNESPKYRGTLDITKKNGGYSLVNTLSMDEYLYAVVPSEMPSSFGVDAGKIQAIIARSYAFNQYLSNKYANYGANIDDSVACQVYNNIPENNISIKAVNETSGKCVTYNDNVITTYFFSTSCGMTANSGEVWCGNNLERSSPQYLSSESLLIKGNFGDLSDEKNAEKFLKDTNVNAYEKNSEFFRWNTTMTNEEISTSINKNLEALYTTSPNSILAKQKDGSFKSENIKSIGLVKDLKILKRGQGGNVIELEIVGTDKTLKVISEFNIRMLLKPYQYIDKNPPIILNLIGTSMKNYSMLPSGFFVMDISYDKNKNLQNVKFYGGGNGHGVGLSQIGAVEMLKAGINYEDVIKYFYKGCDISQKL